MKCSHVSFKDKISESTFTILEDLYRWNLINDCKINKKTEEYVFNKLKWKIEKNTNTELKIKVIYHRYCILIKKLLEEYSELEYLDREEIIDYYLWNNELKELKSMGLSYYYDYKFKKSSATIYKGRSKEVNWSSIRNSKLNNVKGIEAVKGIVRSCREHINQGGDVELRSFSKCLGIDLFKYISLYEHEGKSLSADIYIKKNADINIIKTPNGEISIQHFIYQDLCINNCDFAIDFSTSRDDKRENFEKWYKDFMNTKFVDLYKTNIADDSMKSYYYFMNLLSQKQENDIQISKMVSPLSDKEVIVSGDIWGECVEFDEKNIIYSDGIVCNYNDDKKCVHFNLKEEELYKLIYRYYQKYAEEKNQVFPITFEREYDDFYEKLIMELKNNDTSKNSINIELLNKMNKIKEEAKKTSKKIETILSFVSWNNEEIKLDWNKDNIYNKKKENLFVNLLKCILIDTYKISKNKGAENNAK